MSISKAWIGALLIAAGAPASAATYHYTLVGGSFADGGAMTGGFDYDTETGLGAFSFSTTASGGFAARVYDNASTSPNGANDGYVHGYTPEGWFQLVSHYYTTGTGPNLSDGGTIDIDHENYSGVYDGGAYRWFGASAQLVAAPIPEPGEWAMISAGLLIAGAVARRRRA